MNLVRRFGHPGITVAQLTAITTFVSLNLQVGAAAFVGANS